MTTREQLIARRNRNADSTRAARRERDFGKSFPALMGETVLQGHADWCAEHGHAKHVTVTADGNSVTSPTCPRCGESAN